MHCHECPFSHGKQDRYPLEHGAFIIWETGYHILENVTDILWEMGHFIIWKIRNYPFENGTLYYQGVGSLYSGIVEIILGKRDILSSGKRDIISGNQDILSSGKRDIIFGIQNRYFLRNGTLYHLANKKLSS